MPSIIEEDIIVLIHSNEDPPGGTTFVDSGPNAFQITTVGDAYHKDDDNFLGLTSVSLDGSGDSLNVDVSGSPSPLQHGGDAFTYAAWIRPRAATYGNYFSTRDNATQGVTIRNNGTKIQAFYGNGAGNIISSSSWTVDVPFHLALTKDEFGSLRMFMDGVIVAETSAWDRPDINTNVTTLNIGENNNAEWGNFDAKEIIVANKAIWTEAFTPPTDPWAFQEAVFVSFESYQSFISVVQGEHAQSFGEASFGHVNSTQVLSAAKKLNINHGQMFDTGIPVFLQDQQMFEGMVQAALTFAQVMRCYIAPITFEFIQNWESYAYDIAHLTSVQLIGAQTGATVQETDFSILIAGTPVGITDCRFDRNGFANAATVMLRNRSDWVNKEVGDPVVLTVLGEHYEMIVTSMPQDEQIGQGSYEVGYTVECASSTAQLAEGINPDISASRITASFTEDTMLTEVLDALTDGVCSYHLEVPDFLIGAYVFEDSERYAALRTVLPEQYGWLINTDKEGVLWIKQWSMPEIGGEGQKTLAFKRKVLTPPANMLYNQVEILNYTQKEGASGLRLEVVDNGDGTGTIYGYSVPWTDAFSVFDSEYSSAPSLIITGGAVEEADIIDLDVEFVEYGAALSKPCYSAPEFDWGNNDSLSPVIYEEAGVMSTAAAPGYSVATEVKYTTRRKMWVFDNRKIDVSQIRLRYDTTD